MATMRDKFLLALKLEGWTVVKDTGKRIVMSNPAESNNLYIGKSGSLRIGRTSVSSIPVSEKRKYLLCQKYDLFLMTGRK